MTENADKGQIEEINRLKNRLAKKNLEIKQLKRTNLFLNSLFNGINEEIMVIDQNFVLNDVNRAFLNRCNLTKKDVLGRKCHEITKRSWMPCISGNGSCPVEASMKTGETVEISHSFQDESGNTREHLIIMYPITPEDEDTRYFLEITRDISDYRHLLLRAQKSEKRFKAILDTATDAIISIDEKHRIILFNNAAQRIFGYSSDEAIGRDLGMLIPRSYGDHHFRIMNFLKNDETDVIGKTLSLQGLDKYGKMFPIEISISLLDMGGDVTFTAIIRDVTLQKHMERKMLQSERLAAVGQAVAHVAHEIKNPLMIIGGFSSQIKNRLESEKDISKIEMVLDEVVRLERLAANLGDFTKEYRLIKKPASINSVISDVLNIMAGMCAPGKYEFKKMLSKDINETECDPDKLKQVFINIISNGLEAMPEGGTITISTKKIDTGVEIRISDQGSGISCDDVRQIFEPFYTTRENGCGLGLAISYKLIEAHNGDIHAISSPGNGTTFIIQLPE